MRILPRNHDGVNEEWLADRSRFVWDGLRRQRLDRPYVRVGGRLKPATWGEAFAAVAAAVKGKKVAGLVGDLASGRGGLCAEGAGRRARRDGGVPDRRGEAAGGEPLGLCRDGDDRRHRRGAGGSCWSGPTRGLEAPVLNARIRKAWLNGATVGLIGEAVDLTYGYEHLGTGPRGARRGGRQGARRQRSGSADGGDRRAGRADRRDGAAVLGDGRWRFCEATASKLLVLHTAASRVGAMDLGCVTEGGIAAALEGAEVVYNLGADEIDVPAGPFVIYQGSHGDRGAHRADVILPGAAWTEEAGIFVNTEGRPQMANRAGFPPGEARENWAILRALSAELGTTLPFDSLAALRAADGGGGAAPRRGSTWCRRTRGRRCARAAMSGAATSRSAVREHYLANPMHAGERGDGGAGAAGQRAGRPADGGGVGAMDVLHQRLRAVPPDPGAVPGGDAGRAREPRVPDVRRPQDLGGGAAAARAERGRALGAAAELRRLPEVHRQGDRHPGRGRQGGVPAGADGLLRAAGDRLGGDPLGAGLGDLRHERRDPVHLRDLVAARLRDHHGRLGVELEVSVPRRRCARRRR